MNRQIALDPADHAPFPDDAHAAKRGCRKPGNVELIRRAEMLVAGRRHSVRKTMRVLGSALSATLTYWAISFPPPSTA